jgi:uncharacterized C2H2 Zn-finger protein
MKCDHSNLHLDIVNGRYETICNTCGEVIPKVKITSELYPPHQCDHLITRAEITDGENVLVCTECGYVKYFEGKPESLNPSSPQSECKHENTSLITVDGKGALLCNDCGHIIREPEKNCIHVERRAEIRSGENVLVCTECGHVKYFEKKPESLNPSSPQSENEFKVGKCYFYKEKKVYVLLMMAPFKINEQTYCNVQFEDGTVETVYDTDLDINNYKESEVPDLFEKAKKLKWNNVEVDMESLNFEAFKPDIDAQNDKFRSGSIRSAALEGKRYDLISPIALEILARACAEGTKYPIYNCEKGFPIWDLANHVIEHLFRYLSGDRSENHLGKVMWGAGMMAHSERMWPYLNKGTLRKEGMLPPDNPENKYWKDLK